MQNKNVSRLPKDAGIAIGPILFVVAILGILAAAIAAGSGSFTGSSASESSKTKAAALIDMGQNLKVGVDRMLGLGYDGGTTSGTSIDINPVNTSGDDDLFSPSGGGISAPSVAMANTPSTDRWNYSRHIVTNMGSATATTGRDLTAFIRIAATVCNQVNVKVVGAPATLDVTTNVNYAADAGNLATDEDGNWAPALAGQMTGCFKNTASAPWDGYWYYQVLAIQ
ncbi:MAG: hypothetical protein WDO70_04600 [Alphaproteobacteria bacterium]